MFQPVCIWLTHSIIHIAHCTCGCIQKHLQMLSTFNYFFFFFKQVICTHHMFYTPDVHQDTGDCVCKNGGWSWFSHMKKSHVPLAPHKSTQDDTSGHQPISAQKPSLLLFIAGIVWCSCSLNVVGCLSFCGIGISLKTAWTKVEMPRLEII